MKNNISIWIGKKIVEENDDDTNILKDIFKIKEYDEDMEEIYFVSGKLSKINELVEPLSFSETFIEAVIEEANKLNIKEGSYIIALYDFAYDESVLEEEVEEPIFLGTFEYDDFDEDNEDEDEEIVL